MSTAVYNGPEFGSTDWLKHWGRRSKSDIMLYCVAPMSVRIMEMQNRLDACDWQHEVDGYDVYNDHPLAVNNLGRVRTDDERERYERARVEYGQMADDAACEVEKLRPGARAKASDERRRAMLADKSEISEDLISCQGRGNSENEDSNARH